ncbi:polyphosphate polymerase domain-containing protein [Paenibacillus thiaminolyticus]|uniref:polyphosphate polymerase domain-containing protein n=1 Tax=Paenibacillus thiaminolyticus TaxID=49283 RepID=UPI003D296B6F
MGTALKLKYRQEQKFYANAHQYMVIRQRLKSLMQTDPHAGPSGEYHIRSLYFDDINNKALHDKLGGIRNREKWRIRIYNLQGNRIQLEKKVKRDDYIAKLKEDLSPGLLQSIMDGDIEALNQPDRPLLYAMYREMKHRLLRPKVIVDYVREAYVAWTGNVRITFDKQLKTGLNATDLLSRDVAVIPALDENFVIMEVKYDEYLPEYLQAALQLEGLKRQSASKYVICRKFIKTSIWEDQ